MKNAVTAFAAGLIFGLDLILPSMGNPTKEQNFWDFFGHWDPSLALLMAGAITVGLVASGWGKRRAAAQLPALLGETMHATKVDRRRLTGAALFGIGWGLAGFCPGPAIMSLTTLQPEVLWFVAAMLVGMALQHLWAGSQR